MSAKQLIKNTELATTQISSTHGGFSVSPEWEVAVERHSDVELIQIIPNKHRPGISLRSEVSGRWVRLLQFLNTADIDGEILELTLRIGGASIDQPDAIVEWIEILEQEPTGGLRYFCRVATSLPLPRSVADINLRVPTPAFDESRRYSLCFQVTEPTLVVLEKVELFTHSRKNAPLIIAEFRAEQRTRRSSDSTPAYEAPVLKARGELLRSVERLNRQASTVAKSDNTRWLLNYADTAMRLESYDVAKGVLRHVEPAYESLAAPVKTWFLVSSIRTLIALGETEKIGTLLARYGTGADFANDRLKTILSMLPEFFDEDEDKLLSNRQLNFAGLLAHGISLERLIRLANSTGVANDKFSLYLAFASCAKTQREELWSHFMNKFLQERALPGFKLRPKTSESRVLDRIEFQELPQARNGPLVSVIIAAYNAESTIASSVESILRQSYRNIEVLVCDDRSTDRTSEVLKVLCRSDSRVRAFVSSENQGPYNIRNELTLLSSGPIIAFQDADDISLPNRISEQLEALTNNEVVAIYSKMLRISDDGEIAFFQDQIANRTALISLMAHKETLEAVGGFRSSLCGADSEFYESLKDRLGEASIMILDRTHVLMGWSDGSLTGAAGVEANELGYRAPARRAYSSALARQRILGPEILGEDHINSELGRYGIYRAPSKVIELNQESHAE